MIGPKEKKERSLGEHLHVKGKRCDSPKCALVRRPNRPGVHGASRKRKALSDFGRQLREKQKFKVVYGLDERNLRKIFETAQGAKLGVAEKLLELLERRLDNTLFRLGFAESRSMGRQLVFHGHIFVNGKRVRSPGFLVSTQDVIAVGEHSRGNKVFQDIKPVLEKKDIPAWLAVDASKLEGTVLSLPRDTQIPFEINLLVESFSK